MTLLLAFALSAGYRRDPTSESRTHFPWIELAGFYGVMIWLAALAADSGW